MKIKSIMSMATFIFLSIILLFNPENTDAQTIMCEGTIAAWKNDKSMRQYMATHDCYCPSPNSMPVCTPKSSSSKSSTSSSPNLSASQEIAVTIFGGILDGLMRELFSDEAPSNEKTESPEERMKREQEQKLRKEAYRAKVKEQIAMADNEYARLKREEFEKEKKELVSDLKSRYAATYGKDAKTGNAFRQLQCSAYWGIKAAEMASQGNDSLARLYGEYSARAKEGVLTVDCPETNTNIPAPPNPQSTGGLQEKMYEFILEETQQIVPVMNGLREKKKVTDKYMNEKRLEVETLLEKRNNVEENEKQELDALLLQASKLLDDAIEEDKKANEELTASENKLKALQEMQKLNFNDNKTGKQELKK